MVRTINCQKIAIDYFRVTDFLGRDRTGKLIEADS